MRSASPKSPTEGRRSRETNVVPNRGRLPRRKSKKGRNQISIVSTVHFEIPAARALRPRSTVPRHPQPARPAFAQHKNARHAAQRVARLATKQKGRQERRKTDRRRRTQRHFRAVHFKRGRALLRRICRARQQTTPPNRHHEIKEERIEPKRRGEEGEREKGEGGGKDRVRMERAPPVFEGNRNEEGERERNELPPFGVSAPVAKQACSIHRVSISIQREKARRREERSRGMGSSVEKSGLAQRVEGKESKQASAATAIFVGIVWFGVCGFGIGRERGIGFSIGIASPHTWEEDDAMHGTATGAIGTIRGYSGIGACRLFGSGMFGQKLNEPKKFKKARETTLIDDLAPNRTRSNYLLSKPAFMMRDNILDQGFVAAFNVSALNIEQTLFSAELETSQQEIRIQKKEKDGANPESNGMSRRA
ncbi:hypothetical protein C8R45DRAFT_939319 [Mycena sanguinolenta]|nr:hypothetical protein C8R45DRAFT_939319 [Mycena sanguinolenta]